MLNNRFAWLGLMSLLWGGTFAFIKVASRGLEPEAVVAARMLFATLTVAPFALLRFGARGIWMRFRPIWPRLLLLTACTFFIPTFLLSWGEQRIDSGLAAVLVAGTPLYAALLSLRMARHDTVSGLRLGGLFVGFVGVAMLVGVQPSGNAFAAFVVALVGVLYAIVAILTDRWLSDVPPLIAATGMFGIGSLVMIPLAIGRLPTSMPETNVVLGTVALGSICTGGAFMTWVYVISRWGASFGVLSNYLVPLVALLYGALFLGESVTASGLLGLLLVLLGIGLGSGAVGRRRNRAPDPAEAGESAHLPT
jgi:drug/metabolite transporter (DMT)-like permease